MNNAYRRRPRIPLWLKWMIVTSAVFAVLFVSLFVYLTVDAMMAIINDQPLNPAIGLVREGEDAVDEPALKAIFGSREKGDEGEISAETTPQAPIESQPLLLPTALPSSLLNSDERMTILVMGVDTRPDASSKLTDTMIVFSYDPDTESGSMLSIPRDLYVDIPGQGRNRINTAFTLGSRDGGGDEGGAQLAMRTIEHNLDLDVDHYVLLDFQTAIDVVDAIGGLTIDVPKTIDDPSYPDMNYGYDPLYIEAGERVMDGELSLKYMRTRHGDNDFFRAERQQQVIMAFRNKVLGTTAGIANAPTIIGEMREGIHTNLTVNDMLALANAGRGLSADNIQSAVLNYDYVYSYRTPGGASVLVLRTDEVTELMAQMFQ